MKGIPCSVTFSINDTISEAIVPVKIYFFNV